MSIKNWISKKLANKKINPIWRLFLTGVKGQLELKQSKPYGYYLQIVTMMGTLAFGFYLLQFKKLQIDTKGYNIFIPDYIYKVREENHIYWETVRNSRDLPSMFAYYKWDENLMFQIDRAGIQSPFQTHKGLQNTKTFQSPLHQYNFPASTQTHNRILLYLKNIKNPYDLENYLRAKPINMGDWIRTIYYILYRQTGFSNRWRYDEYVSKPSIYYQWEKMKYAFLLSRDREALYNTLDKWLPTIETEDVVTFLFWFL